MDASGKALVLDFGGVVTKTLFETHRESEQILGLPTNSLTWLGPFDPESDSLWCAMQDDEITEREYWRIRTQQVGELVGEKWEQVSDFVRRVRGADAKMVIRPEALDTINRVHQAGLRLAILSNELDLFYGRDLKKNLPFLSKFQVIVDASHSEILKPDHQAYLACISELGLNPAECVFVDDQLRNIRGAEEVGMQVVHFDVRYPKRSYSEALAKLGLNGAEHSSS